MTDEIPDDLRLALDQLDPEDADEALQDYLNASPDEQADMLAFIRSTVLLEGRLDRARQEALKQFDGVPTAADLEGWLAL